MTRLQWVVALFLKWRAKVSIPKWEAFFRGGPAAPGADFTTNSGSCRQFRAGLFRHHVRGVPVGPVRVCSADPILMLAVRDRRAPHRARQIRHRGEARRVRVDPTREACRELLQQPAIAVPIRERQEPRLAAPAHIEAPRPYAC